MTSVANLFAAWKEFRRGKNKKEDVRDFEFNLEDNLFRLHEELISKRYQPDPYEAFFVHDPKRRHIHKASVRDRVLHQAIFRILYPIFEKDFIYHSYSSRIGKGTHKGVRSLYVAIQKVSRNWKSPAYALKCDIRKFFDSIDHEILFEMIKKKINDEDTLRLLGIVIESFCKSSLSDSEKTNVYNSDGRQNCIHGRGLPLGNVTSQLFANVYLNLLDQFVKHTLQEKHYFRYADDFIILNENEEDLHAVKRAVSLFLKENLKLDLHKDKVFIRKVSQGIDFLGYVILPGAIVLRTKTKQRILGRVREDNIHSYEGMLAHCKGHGILSELRKIVNS